MGKSEEKQLAKRNNQKEVPPTNEREIFTSRKHSMDYFTSGGVILRTGYKNKRDWYLLPVREMMDNSSDFLCKNYKGSSKASITVSVHMDNNNFTLTVRNSNPANVPVFSDLKAIFDYDMRYGSKQDVHIISRGMLGDAMKQILSLGYVLLHTRDDGTAFTDKQWERPLVVRHNGKETHVTLTVDKATQSWQIATQTLRQRLAHTDTEIQVILPVIDEVRDNLDRSSIEQFCRRYTLLTTDISFKFRIIDDIEHSNRRETTRNEELDHMCNLTKVLSTLPDKGILTIDVPAVHPIAAEWNNSDFIHSYKPEEFKARITNVHDKESTTLYDVLIKFREGRNVPKTPENQMTVAQLLEKPNRDKIIEKLFNQLRKVFDAPTELSLPYTTNTKKRCSALVERMSKMYDIDTTAKPSYKLVRGFYTDDETGGIVQYPSAFEIIAIPFKDPYGPDKDWEAPKSQEFIGAVNYSVSPKNNIFEGDYPYVAGGYYPPTDINDVLSQLGFQDIGRAKNRLPCVIVGNLITPRRDPQGYDKSSIDTKPFTHIIIQAVQKIAPEIQTYRAAGWRFYGRDDEQVRRDETNKKVNARNLLEQFLIRERGLPGRKNTALTTGGE